MCASFYLQILLVLWGTWTSKGSPNIIERTRTGGPFWIQHDAFECLSASENITYDPLCASDGQTFQNPLAFQCYMQFFKTHLTARKGACSERRHPDHCAFAFIIWRRVCGDDNVTYSSIWELLCTAERLGKPISVQHDGPCLLRCGMALEYRPVCGSDGVLYPNQEALFCKALRYSDLNLTEIEGCQIPGGQACLKGTIGYAGNPDTDRALPLVCASNGITYPNYFSVECLTEVNAKLDIMHDGPCMHEDIHHAIESWSTDNPGMSCHLAETHVLWLPVCTNDGHTFSSEISWHCALVREAIEPDSRIVKYDICSDKDKDTVTKNEDVVVTERTTENYRVWPSNYPDPCSPKNESGSLIVNQPILCASDGRTYYSIKEYSCAIKKYGDWFPCLQMKHVGRCISSK